MDLAMMGNDYCSLNNLHSLPENLIVGYYDHSFDHPHSTLRSSDQWAIVRKKYRDDLIESFLINISFDNLTVPLLFQMESGLKKDLNKLGILTYHNLKPKTHSKKIF
jgi:uncharacterized protein (UPF0297 family)